MKKALPIAMLLIVVLAFSGVASAATQQVLVSEAYDEQVLVSEAYDEQVLVSPAWNESVFNHWLVNGEYYIYHPAELISEAIPEIPAWDELITPEVPAWDELISAEVPAWNETIDPVIEEQEVRTVEYGYQDHWWNSDKERQYKKAVKFADQQVAVHDYNGYYITDHPECGQGHWTVHFLDDVVVEEGYVIEHKAIPAVYEHHDAIPAVYEHHDAIPGVPAVYSQAYVETVPYENNGPYFGGNPVDGLDWNDVSTWANWIHSHPGATGGWGSWNPFYSLIPHEAVYETVHHDAVYETVHHPAVYKDVEVADPVVPVVEPVAKDKVPMQETGKAVAVAFAALAILIAGGLIASRRK